MIIPLVGTSQNKAPGSFKWTCLGPVDKMVENKSNGQGAGRIVSIAFWPGFGKTNQTLLSSSIYGGIWVSSNRGVSWNNVHKDFPKISTDTLPAVGVREIVIDPENGNPIYALLNHGNGNSVGVYRYTKAEGWKPGGLTFKPDEGAKMHHISIHPKNTKTLYAAGTPGVFRSEDMGKTWKSVLPFSPLGTYRRVWFSPANPDFGVIAGPKIYQTRDGGKTWTELSGFFMSGENPEQGSVNTLAVANDSGHIYVAAIFKKQVTVGTKKESRKTYVFRVYKSGSWKDLEIPPMMNEWNEDRLSLNIHPKQQKFLFAGQELLHRYNAQTGKWTTLSDYGSNMHPDIHEIAFAPDGSLWIGHDGGISLAETNIVEGLPTWKTMNKGISIGQIWSFSGSPTKPGIIFCGEPDNGNSYTMNANGDPSKIVWNAYMMGDGGEKLVDWSDSMFVYDRQTMYSNTSIMKYRLKDGKITHRGAAMRNITPSGHFYEDWATPKPIVQDPKRPNIIYRGLNGLARSTDGGKTSELIFRSGVCFDKQTAWGSLVTSIAIFPIKTDVIYINTTNPYDSTRTDGIFRTRKASTCAYVGPNGCTDGASENCECDCWENISPDIPGYGLATWQQAKSKILCLAVHDKNANLAWAGFSYSPYNKNLKVMRFFTRQWIDISEGLPEHTSVNALVHLKGSKEWLFAGTDDGVYYWTPENKRWYKFGNNFPNIKVTGLEINYQDKTLRAGTMGRGIWSVPLPYAENTDKKENKKDKKKNAESPNNISD